MYEKLFTTYDGHIQAVIRVAKSVCFKNSPTCGMSTNVEEPLHSPTTTQGVRATIVVHHSPTKTKGGGGNNQKTAVRREFALRSQ